MAEQTEDAGHLEQPHDSVSDHELFTQMLFVDAIIGVGFPSHEVGMLAEHEGLADLDSDQHGECWTWKTEMLWELSIEALQALYNSLKMHEASHT